MDGGELIKHMQLRVKAAYPPKTGTNSNGDWKLQSATLSDDTGEIRATFFDIDRDIRQLQGNLIDVVSGKDAKGNTKGIETYDYEDKKNNKVTRQITISRFAIIDEVTGAPSSAKPNESSVGQSNRNSFVSGPDEKGVSIEKQVALKCAVDFISKAATPTTSTVIETAHRFYNEFFAAKPKPEPELQPEQEAPKPEGEQKVI